MKRIDITTISNEEELQLAINEDLRIRCIPYDHRYKSKGGRGQRPNIFKANGKDCAWLDLTLFLDLGRTIFIEIKWGYNKLSEEQKNFCEYQMSRGYHCYTVWTWAGYQTVLKEEGII
jgi:hypothetical protein